MWIAIYNRVVRIGLADSVTFEQRLKGEKLLLQIHGGREALAALFVFYNERLLLLLITPPPRGNHYFDFYHNLLVLPVLELDIDGIIQYVLFCVWLLSFIMVSVIFTHVIVYLSHCSFSWLCIILLYEYTTNVFIHSPVDGHFRCCQC